MLYLIIPFSKANHVENKQTKQDKTNKNRQAKQNKSSNSKKRTQTETRCRKWGPGRETDRMRKIRKMATCSQTSDGEKKKKKKKNHRGSVDRSTPRLV